MHLVAYSKSPRKPAMIARNPQKNAENDSAYFFVRSEYKMIKIELDNIVYIEGLEDYIKIHMVNEKPVLTLMTLKAIIEKLPPKDFKRIHRSYIIPVNKVKSILNRKVTLTTGTELPISDSYASFINEWTKGGAN